MLRKLSLIICLLNCLISAAVHANTDRQIKQDALLPESIYAFSGIDPKQRDDSDLAPLDRIIGKAHVVALGESVHTSGGFHDVRFRIIRHLIRDKGFRVLAMESNRLQSQPLVDFIASCTHSASVDDDQLRQAMTSSLFESFASENMKDMLTWICQFNAAHPSDAVSFAGFDMQESSNLSPAIAKTLSADGVAPQISNALKDIQHCAEKNVWGAVTSDLEQFCSAVIDGEMRLLSDAKTAGLSSEEFELLKLNLRSLRANVEQYYLGELGAAYQAVSYQARDEAMADVFLTLQSLYWKHARVIVWAHNTHIEREGLSDSQPAGPSLGPFKNMGQYLSESLKADYRSIGILAHQAELNWASQSLVCVTAGLAFSHPSAELKLRLLNRPYLLVDTAAMRKKPASFFIPNAEYGYSQGDRGPIDREFDGLVYLQHSQAMVPLGQPACPVKPD